MVFDSLLWRRQGKGWGDPCGEFQEGNFDDASFQNVLIVNHAVPYRDCDVVVQIPYHQMRFSVLSMMWLALLVLPYHGRRTRDPSSSVLLGIQATSSIAGKARPEAGLRPIWGVVLSSFGWSLKISPEIELNRSALTGVLVSILLYDWSFMWDHCWRKQ